MIRQKRFIVLGLVCIMVLVGVSLVEAGRKGAQQEQATPTLSATAGGIGDLRNVRYCEILPVVRQGVKLVASVYNTLGLNDCPDESWKAMDVDAIKKQFKAFEVQMNGPRYFMMNQIISKGATANGETVMIGGLGFTKRAEVVLSLTTMKSIPYEVRDIERDTTYVFKKGNTVFELVDADGNTYVMQSYSLTVDATLTVDDLPTLGDQLKLPKGWVFQTVELDHDLVLTANGVAHLVQDDLSNSYQRIESADLTATQVDVPTETVTASATP